MSLSSQKKDLQNPNFKGIHTLSLHHFRNYPSFTITPEEGMVVITGDNGTGKTNILEALSFLAPGKGLRNIRLSQAIHFPKHAEFLTHGNGWTVYAELCNPQHTHISIGTSFVKEQEIEKRLIKINGTFSKNQNSLKDYISVLWLTPQMDGLFIQGGSERRRFLDRLTIAFDPNHLERLNRYNHYLKERSGILTTPGFKNPSWLSQIEQFLAQDAVAIAVSRYEIIQRLNAWHSRYFPPFSIHMNNSILNNVLEKGALFAEEQLIQEYCLARGDDERRGGSTIGPHRHDYTVEHLIKKLDAAHCSTGEQRVLLLGIILSFACVLNSSSLTLLLLDDVVSFLDSEHRRFLFEELILLKNQNFQIWLTGTDPFVFQDLSMDAYFHSTSG